MASSSLIGVQSFFRYFIASLIFGIPIFGSGLVVIGSFILVVMKVMSSNGWGEVLSMAKILFLLLIAHLLVLIVCMWVGWDNPKDFPFYLFLAGWVVLFAVSQFLFPRIAYRM